MSLSTSTDTIPEVDVSDLANLSADVSIHHDVWDTPSLQWGLFQNSTCNEMLSHYNRVVIGCFKDFFQSVDMNNLAEVLQALKELNFVLANRAPELAAHYNMTLEPTKFLHRKYLTLSRHISTVLQLTTLSRALEEDAAPEVTNIIGTIVNHLHYWGTINKHIGQMHIFILILIEITIILITTIIVNVILLIPLDILIIQVTVKLML